MSKILHQPLNGRNLRVLILCAAGLALALWGGHWAYQRINARPLTTAEVRTQIWRFLRKESHHDDFKIAMDLASLTNSTAAEATATTNSTPAGEPALKGKRARLDKPLKIKAKAKKLSPLQTEFSRFFREKQSEASTYETIYRLIGEELWVAEQLFANTNTAVQQTGVVLASEAAHYAIQDAENGWLAARICEGYLWPSLDLLEKAERPVTTPEQLLATCEAAFRANDETASLARNYEYLIRQSPKRADTARFRLAMLYEKAGEDAKALRTLQDIQGSQSGKIQTRIAALKERLQSKSRK